MTEIIKSQPEDSSESEILKESAFNEMVERGFRDIKNGKTIENEEMKRRVFKG